MNTKLLLIAVALVTLSSCSSVYKSGQTPDDVYYSPVRMYDVEEKKDDNRKEDSRTYAEQSQIRLGINNPRWRYLDDYSYNPYLYGYNYGYYYNPYYYQWPVYNYGTVVTVNPKNNTPRMTNLSAYNNAYNNNNMNGSSKYSNPVNMPVRSYNNSSRLSSTLNKIFNNGSNYNNSNNSQNNSNQGSRSYSPSSNSSNSTRSSSSGSSSSGGSTSRPVRNGKG